MALIGSQTGRCKEANHELCVLVLENIIVWGEGASFSFNHTKQYSQMQIMLI